jgi:transposase
MSTFTQFCGIDVSKSTLDYCLSQPQKPQIFEQGQIPNELEPIAGMFLDARFDHTLFVLEHTGNYSSKVLYQLTRLNRSVSVVSPLKSRDYMAAQGITNKNDKQAAHSLALMGQHMELRLYKAPAADMQQRKQRLSTLRALEKQQRMLKNQLHALEQLPLKAQDAQTALETVLEAVEAQIKPLKESLCEASKNPDFDKNKAFATSVVGIGNKTAEAILLVTNGLEEFDNYDKVSKFLGLIPLTHRSGTSVRKNRGIAKYGSGEVRGLLYMCTNSAIRYNQPCKDLYQRLRKNGKPHKLAAVAVMHKLVKQVFACVKTETLFDNQYHLKNKKAK